MSSEHLVEKKFIDTSNSLNVLSSSYTTLHKVPGRVNINKLMLNLREKEKKEKKENLVFLSLIISVVMIVGMVASF